MQIEQVRPMVLRVTLHAYELASLIAAARWIVEGTEGERPDEAIKQLRRVIANYDTASQRSKQQ